EQSFPVMENMLGRERTNQPADRSVEAFHCCLGRLWTAERANESKPSSERDACDAVAEEEERGVLDRFWVCRSEQTSQPANRSVEAFHCRAVYGPPSARAGETGGAPWKARERDSTGCRSGATVEREVSEGSESPERSRRTKPGIY